MYKNSQSFIYNIENLRNKNNGKYINYYKGLVNFPNQINRISTLDDKIYKPNVNIHSIDYSRLSQSQKPKKNYTSLEEYNFFNNQNSRRKKTDDYEFSNYNLNRNNTVKQDELKLIISSKIGLNNLGNTCYMNTCLQNLIHSQDFIERLLKKKSIINGKLTPITHQFLNLCQKILYSRNSIEPEDFKYYFGKKHPEYKGYGQNDTQEFCRIVLEDMNEELNEVKYKVKYKELSTKGKSKGQCDKEFDELFHSKESSIVIDSFYGQIVNIFTCDCSNEVYSFEKVMELPLLLPGGKSSISIEDLLDEYFREDIIKFNTNCENCKRRGYRKKEIKFSQPPNILILSLQRMDLRINRKNNCAVEFSEKLRIKKYIDEECGNRHDYKYKLYGIGCHSGQINKGHYYAYIKIKDKDWYEFNDSKVNYYGDEINTKNIFSSVYILFYKKRKKNN